jgi:hypothetical protein
MSERRRRTTRTDERQKLKDLWEENCKRRKAGWPPTAEHLERYGDLAQVTSHTLALDAQGKTVTVTETLRGERARAAINARYQYFAELRARVEGWNKGTPDKKAKEISGENVMEVLDLAFALTNHPAYEAAREAMRLHRLNKGGVRRAFLNLLRRHHEPPEYSCVLSVEPEPDSVTWYMEEYGFKLRKAVEYVVASEGIPGASFDDAVEKVRKAYAKHEKHAAEQQRYLSELAGQRSSGDSR